MTKILNMPRKQEEPIRRRRVATRGKPPTASLEEPEDLSERIKAFGDLVMMNIPPAIAGQLVDPPAKEQQVSRWLDDCPGLRKYFIQKGMEAKFDEVKSNTEAVFAEQVASQQKAIVIASQLSLLRKVNSDEVNDKFLWDLIREGQLTMQVVDSVHMDAKEKSLGFTDKLLDGLSDKDKALLSGGSLIQKMIAYKKE